MYALLVVGDMTTKDVAGWWVSVEFAYSWFTLAL